MRTKINRENKTTELKKLQFKTRAAWRAWLEKNHSKSKGIWLVYFKKHSTKASVAYNDAVEEAICFGWIDSKVRTVDAERYMQIYTPRNKKSIWSYTNIKRARRMVEEKKMTPVGLAIMPPKVREAVKTGKINTFNKKGLVIPKVLPMPKDLKDALAGNIIAEKNWESFAPSHKKMYIWWVLDAKRLETRERRIKEVVRRSEDNIKSGMV
jgi:uncharacterized protein YdeI (YjbR/CyaY-like superfamily)